jgi:2-isopropylmalate synthase
VVCGLSRAGELDIDRAGEAVKHAARPRIHTFIATSPVHRKHKLMKSAEEVLEMVHFQVARARNWVPDVEWSAEDATRTEIDYLCRCVETALKAGATTINLPDTVGYATPEEYYQMFRTVMEKVPGSEKAIFSVHCHNDLGMAVANSLAGVRAGCRQIECTINGIGERAGNAALEEVVMAIKTRGDALPYEVGIDATMLNRASKLVAAATSFPVQYNKAIVGPQCVRARERHPPGRHAQAHADLRDHDAGVGGRVQDLAGDGQALRAATPSAPSSRRWATSSATTRWRTLQPLQGAGRPQEARLRRGPRGAGRRGDRHRPGPHEGGGADRDRRHRGPQSATLTLDMGDGKQQTVQSTGNGPVDATFNAIHKLVPHKAKLALYQVHAVTEGTDAQAEVSVRLEDEARAAAPSPRARRIPTRWWRAPRRTSARLNKLFAKRGRLHAQQSA